AKSSRSPASLPSTADASALHGCDSSYIGRLMEQRLEQDRCGACGGPHEARQEYCLECGARLVSAVRRVHWLWPSLVALGIAVAGGAVAIAATGGQGGSPPRTIVATQALVLVPANTSRAPAPPTSSTSAVPLPARVGQLVTWPSGK